MLHTRSAFARRSSAIAIATTLLVAVPAIPSPINPKPPISSSLASAPRLTARSA